MKSSPTRHYAIALILLVALSAVIVGGIFMREKEAFEEDQRSSNATLSSYEDWLVQNPCGVLSLNGPFYSVTGTLADTGQDQQLRLFVVKNFSHGAAAYSEERCMQLVEISVSPTGQFALAHIPCGTYALTRDQATTKTRITAISLNVARKEKPLPKWSARIAGAFILVSLPCS